MPAHSKAAKPSAQIAVIGIDIGKNVFHLIGLDRSGAIVLKAKLSRGQLENRLANLPPCLIGMEACVGSHHLSRRLIALGHDARLMPAQYVKPFLKGHKNDYRDAEASAEAVQRPTMRFVAAKRKNSSICKRCIACGLAWWRNVPQPLTQSGPSCLNAALLWRKAFIVCAKLCPIFLPKPRMPCRRA